MTKFKMVLIGGMEVGDPIGERWLLREHVGETISWIGPWLERYVRYWSVLPPADMVPDLVRYGSYRSGVTMHVYNDFPPEVSKMWGMVAMIPRGDMPAMSPGEAYASFSNPDTPRPVSAAMCYVPFEPTQDFKGNNLNPWETSILRWFTMTRYPEGVPIEDGEKWFLDVHSREVMEQPGLIRYFSYRPMDFGGPAPFHRVTEQWYTDYYGWHKSVIESPPEYTKPPWATYDRYPFFEPNKDFLGTFILERPTHDCLKDDMHYIIGP